MVHLPKHNWNFYISLAWNIVIFFPVMFAVKFIVASFSYMLFLGLSIILLVGKSDYCYTISILFILVTRNSGQWVVLSMWIINS